MHSSDFFRSDASVLDPFGLPSQPGPVLKVDLLDRLCAGPISEHTDLSAAEGLFDLVEQELYAYGQAGSDLTDQQSVRIIRTLEAVTRRLGIPIGLPFRSFETFRGYWSSKGASGSGGWAARRDLIAEMFDPARERLDRLRDNLGPTVEEPLIADLRDPAAIREHLGRLQGITETDPPLAIGTAKELIESTAKTVLQELDQPLDERDDLPALVSKAQRALSLHPQSASPGPDSTEAVRRILGGLITMASGLGELRNRGYGTGHGPAGRRVGLRPRHARLAVSAAVTWCNFVLDTLGDIEAPWQATRE